MEGTAVADEAKKVMTEAQRNAAFETAKALMPAEVKKADLLAEMRKIHYDASIRKGFTKDEALFLCTMMNFD